MYQRQIDQRYNHNHAANVKELNGSILLPSHIYQLLLRIREVQWKLPLHDLWILCANDDVAYGWKTSNVDCLLSKAKVAENEAHRESKCMTNGGCYF